MAAVSSPFFLNDTIHIRADIGAGNIQGGSHILIDRFQYALDCGIGQTINNCVAEGNQVTLDDLNITTNCLDSNGSLVTWQVTEANIRTFTPTSNLPVQVPANSRCRVEFDVSVNALNGIDNLVHESLGWGAGDARCDNGLAADAASTVNIIIQECSIELTKEVSVDGGATWHDANDPGSAPDLQVPGDAQYRLTVENTGTVAYVQPINIVDTALGIDTTIPALAAGASTVVDGGDIPGLNAVGRCKSVGSLENISSAEAFCRTGASPVSDMAEDNAWVNCTVPPAIDILKEISVDGGSTWHDANDAGSAPVVDAPSGAEYRITVSNPGATDLVNVVVNDTILGVVNFSVGNLAAGTNVVLTSGDIPALSVEERCGSAGTFTNTATADGNSAESGKPVPQASDLAVLVCVNPPLIDILKEISVDGGSTWHDANDAGSAPVVDVPSGAQYRITVSNPGPMDLVNVVVNDAQLGIVAYLVGDLPAGASVELTSGDIPALGVAERCKQAGTFTNTATADGDSADTGNPAPQASDPANLVCVDPPIIDILKEISVDGGATWHDANDATSAPVVAYPSGAEYRIIVSNPGTADLVGVVVNDAQLGIVDFPVGNLSAGANVELTSGDIPALGVAERCDGEGTFTNTAAADGNSAATGSPAPQASDPANLVCTGDPVLDIEKEISVDGGATWFDADSIGTAPPAQTWPSGALYRLIVCNTGNVPVTSIMVSDPDLGIPPTAVPGVLPVDDEVTEDHCVTITSGQIAALDVATRCDAEENVSNTAFVTGQATGGEPALGDDDTAWLVCTGEPALDIEKQISVDGGTTWFDADTPATAPPAQTPPAGALYRLIVCNAGNVPVTGIMVSDPSLGISPTPIPGSLPVDDGATQSHCLTITSGEIPALEVPVRCETGGQFQNVAFVTGGSDSAPAEPAAGDDDPAWLVCESDELCLVVIDEEGLDNDFRYVERAADEISAFNGGGDFVTPDELINDHDPTEVGNPPLLWNELVGAGLVPDNIPGRLVLLPTGQVDDEGWFALPPGPNILYKDNSRPPNCGLAGGYGEWIDRFIAGTLSQHCLDEVLDVMPMRNQDLAQMVDKSCVAVVYDSDISINYQPLFGNLQGARHGLFSFTVLALELAGSLPENGSDTSLYGLWLYVEPPQAGAAPVDFVVIRDHEPDSVEIKRATYSGGTLTVIGEGDFDPAFMTLSVDGPDRGEDPTVDPFLVEEPMTDIGRGRWRIEYNTGGVDVRGRRISIQTDEGGAYNGRVRR